MEVATKMIVWEILEITIQHLKITIGLIGAQYQNFILFYFSNILVELEEIIKVYGKVNDCSGPFLHLAVLWFWGGRVRTNLIETHLRPVCAQVRALVETLGCHVPTAGNAITKNVIASKTWYSRTTKIFFAGNDNA